MAMSSSVIMSPNLILRLAFRSSISSSTIAMALLNSDKSAYFNSRMRVFNSASNIARKSSTVSVPTPPTLYVLPPEIFGEGAIYG